MVVGLPLLTSPRGQAMFASAPTRLYAHSVIYQGLLQAEGQEYDAIRAAIQDVLAQAFIQTATWSLSEWEAELGLPIAPPLSDAARRQRAIGKLAGTGTATLRVARRVAESFDNGAIEIAEDYEASTWIVHFVDTRGVPPQIDDLKDALRSVVPAVYALTYQFRYLSWQELRAMNLTWGDLRALNLTWAQLRVLH